MKNFITHFFSLLLMLGLVHVNISAFGQDEIYSESFNYPTGQLPPGWVLVADQPPPWTVNNSQMAGGEAPELALGYSFAAGLSRLVSPQINIEGYEALRLKYKQYLINYAMDWGEVIGQDVTFDGGVTWHVIWEKAITTLNIPPDTYTYYVSVPDGTTQMQIAFRYEGNSNGINWWLIDDIVLESAADNDLLTAAFTGSITPVEGEQTIYTLEVINGGKLTQTSYSVKLMMEGGIELASIPGESISFSQKITYELPWTPGEGNIGSTNIYAIVELAGDEIPENNQTHNLSIMVQPDFIRSVDIGSGNIPLDWLPYNFFNLHSMSQTLYFPEEIGESQIPVTGILYTCQFDEEIQAPIQIWLGETDRNDLTETWVDPSTLTPVFSGTVTFSKGMNQVYIPFDNDYTYGNRNLVIYSYKSYTEMVLGTPFISSFDSNSMRSRLAEGNDAFDPMNPTWGYNSDYYPNITLLYSTFGTSVDKVETSNSLILFPNPANSQLYVQSDEIIREIRMIDIVGQIVFQETGGSRQHEISVSNLKPGFYLVQVVSSKGLTTQKVQVFK
ncbi:MAG: hypothetical protein CVT94_10890 [Bacteroidetes bacterium HGW-Bacteroidetes-11]|jgi:hypothetical protein|nr:MAG: hypothetical protein CVT94_10890 [Bacteroidetes bacterium HGW-Bacteroidetes-11]